METPDMSHIGRYELLCEIDQGGMSSVYYAYDSVMGRHVAIKILPQALVNDARQRARFEREVKIITAVEHPAIVPVYDFGEEAEQPYLVMRFMKGGSLGWRLRRKVFPLVEACNLIIRLAPAIDKFHKLGIVHCDLKPDNILFDEDDNPHIADFGVAKLSAGEGAGSGERILGTLVYASPEHLLQGNKPNALSDIYALGVILFEMVTGEVPYESGLTTQTIEAILHHPVPKVSRLNPALPAALDVLLARAMAKNPARRYASAMEFAAALKHMLSTLPQKPAFKKAAFKESFAKVFPASVPHLRTRPLSSWGEPEKRKVVPFLKLGKNSLPPAWRFNAWAWVIVAGIFTITMSARAATQNAAFAPLPRLVALQNSPTPQEASGSFAPLQIFQEIFLTPPFPSRTPEIFPTLFVLPGVRHTQTPIIPVDPILSPTQRPTQRDKADSPVPSSATVAPTHSPTQQAPTQQVPTQIVTPTPPADGGEQAVPPTRTATPTLSKTVTATSSVTITATPSPTATSSHTPSPSPSPTSTPTAQTPTPTPLSTRIRRPTQPLTPFPTHFLLADAPP